MVPQITISNSLYEKLKSLAVPFEDTQESVIARCVDFYASSHGKATKSQAGDSGPMAFPADGPPDLTFTRPTAIKLDGVTYEKKDLYWNNLLFDVVARASKKVSLDQLKKIILVNYVDGKGEQEKGYRFIETAKISVQGQDSNAAWKAAFHIIKAVGMNIDVSFAWDNKDKAAYPGKSGRMFHEAA